MISVIVNKKEYQVEPDTTIENLLTQLGVNAAATAVAVNDVVVAKTEYASHSLNAGDRILIIKAFYGG